MLSGDAAAPPWGPGFLRLNSQIYRAEYATATVAILLVVFGWRGLVLRELPWTDVLLFVLWWALPDVVAFLPIGIAARGSRSWPSWGPTVYNSVHTLLTFALVFGVASLVFRQIEWPLLGWAAHITGDRWAGYHLRGPVPGPGS